MFGVHMLKPDCALLFPLCHMLTYIFASPVPDLPAEDPGVLALVSLYLGLDLRGGQLGLAAPQDPGPDAAGLLVPGNHTSLVSLCHV